jgi:hypothetical protein
MTGMQNLLPPVEFKRERICSNKKIEWKMRKKEVEQELFIFDFSFQFGGERKK